jgi:hypothetical protein
MVFSGPPKGATDAGFWTLFTKGAKAYGGYIQRKQAEAAAKKAARPRRKRSLVG